MVAPAAFWVSLEADSLLFNEPLLAAGVSLFLVGGLGLNLAPAVQCGPDLAGVKVGGAPDFVVRDQTVCLPRPEGAKGGA